MDEASRLAWASAHDLPPPAALDPVSVDGAPRFCVDVCSELGKGGGEQDCATRCADLHRDRAHACREACQLSFGAACDRAFPGEGDAAEYSKCLQGAAKACARTCAGYD